MKLEVGKEYVVAIPSRPGSSHLIGRCISTDRLLYGKPTALLLCKDSNGVDERVTSVALDGRVVRVSRFAPWVVKEYVPKIKARVIVFTNADGTLNATAIAESSDLFKDPRRGTYLTQIAGVKIVSDTVVEVEAN